MARWDGRWHALGKGCEEEAPSLWYTLPPQQTEILAVTALPDTIVVRDTTLLACVIRDSLDTNFQFRWSIGEGELIGGNERQIQWVAPGKTGTYSHRVEATNGSDRSAPSAWVTVVVVDP